MKNKLNYFIGAMCVGLALLSAGGCKNKKEDQEVESKKLVLLQVDYLTHDFEGGQLIELGPHTNLTDTLPVIVNYTQPMDFGNLSIYYQSTNSTGLVFDGSVIWMGTGTRSFPATMAAAADFPVMSSPLPPVDSTDFQLVHYDMGNQPIYYDSIWQGIHNLDIVNFSRSNFSSKMVLFLYQPSVGAGDPADWDWYILMEL